MMIGFNCPGDDPMAYEAVQGGGTLGLHLGVCDPGQPRRLCDTGLNLVSNIGFDSQATTPGAPRPTRSEDPRDRWSSRCGIRPPQHRPNPSSCAVPTPLPARSEARRYSPRRAQDPFRGGIPPRRSAAMRVEYVIVSH
jgi:hypothetical protein